MEINLSTEMIATLSQCVALQLDELRRRLERAEKNAAKVASPVVRQRHLNTITHLNERLADVQEAYDLLLGMVPPVPVEPIADFRVRQDGSVFVFYPQSDGAKAHVIAGVRPAAWQMLGGFTFAVDHRLAPDVCYQLREDGYTVEVQ